MARGWTPSSWNRAVSIKTGSVEKVRLETELVTLIAIEETIGNKKEYWIQICGAEFCIYTYNNKDEANAKWVELKNKYF